jgi:diguanylate cyclase (GGDEF)-like protein
VKNNNANEVQVTVSIGLAERNAQTRFAAEVLKAADTALYKAKAKGRNRVVAPR